LSIKVVGLQLTPSRYVNGPQAIQFSPVVS